MEERMHKPGMKVHAMLDGKPVELQLFVPPMEAAPIEAIATLADGTVHSIALAADAKIALLQCIGGLPPMAVLVSGGRLAPGVARRIGEFIRDNAGQGLNAPLVIEGLPADTSIELRPLTREGELDEERELAKTMAEHFPDADYDGSTLVKARRLLEAIARIRDTAPAPVTDTKELRGYRVMTEELRKLMRDGYPHVQAPAGATEHYGTLHLVRDLLQRGAVSSKIAVTGVDLGAGPGITVRQTVLVKTCKPADHINLVISGGDAGGCGHTTSERIKYSFGVEGPGEHGRSVELGAGVKVVVNPNIPPGEIAVYMPNPNRPPPSVELGSEVKDGEVKIRATAKYESDCGTNVRAAYEDHVRRARRPPQT
jgi:hypothetical protein